MLGDSIKSTLSVSHGCWRITVDGSEIALPIHERITKGEFLSHTDHGIVNGLITVGVILTHHLTNGTSGFAEFLLSGVPALIHTVEHTAVNRFESITCIRECSPDDHGHGVVDVRIFHFSVQRMVQNNLAWPSFTVVGSCFFIRCQGWSPPLHGAQ